ncbi:MAG: SCO1664 family protein [Actinobacteria bacterium]|jgi:uncharacterized repeat protein (TIGR03843 family)|nr:SCO1664 family protein [Actinomycetota bacterium]
MTSSEWLAADDLVALLSEGELTVEGRIVEASNATLRCSVAVPDGRLLACVYKPVAGERPLWDFPDWTLTRRELAAHALSEATGWWLVPPTVWREDGPGGPGMCQLWIDEDHDAAKVAVVRSGRVPKGWLHVLDAEDGSGRPVALVHADGLSLQRMAAFDAIANNADRKGGHVLTDDEDRTWAIDHGVTFSVEEKLRTVLWGWAGEPLPPAVVDDLTRLQDLLGTSYDPVDRWLAQDERDSLRARVRRLAARGRFPQPSQRWPAIPWPVF